MFKTYSMEREDHRLIKVVVHTDDNNTAVLSLHVRFEDPVDKFETEHMPSVNHGMDEESARLLYEGLKRVFTEIDETRNNESSKSNS